ncbi:hypothetical protein RHMOL_Rhmol08G0216400 [Rhododendron molle]|uniref:Uncharacterized protein n=1 Tax=Rhododendron molle TaxID=49168 RepID=A0ACC0MR83_RHOML|nr:hypothetical protein RHMOL_Rhmol08G0216400 [Rhododendron molle]
MVDMAKQRNKAMDDMENQRNMEAEKVRRTIRSQQLEASLSKERDDNDVSGYIMDTLEPEQEQIAKELQASTIEGITLEFEGEQPEFEQATFNFSRLANEKELVVEGMEVKFIGQVCYNCHSNETGEDGKDYKDHAKKTYKCRLMRDIRLKERKKYLKDYDLNTEIIQLNNLALSEGGVRSPIFNFKGVTVRVVAFVLLGFSSLLIYGKYYIFLRKMTAL